MSGAFGRGLSEGGGGERGGPGLEVEGTVPILKWGGRLVTPSNVVW